MADTEAKGTLEFGQYALVTGANRGVGLELAKQLTLAGSKVIGTCRQPSPEMRAAGLFKIAEGVDVQTDESIDAMVAEIKTATGGEPLGLVVNNAGYFTDERNLDDLHWNEERKMIEICALGPLRVTAALRKAGMLRKGTKVVVITSEGGSIALTSRQRIIDEGSNYGHHMSKAAANMMARLLSYELQPEGIPVLILHPGFVRTDMTKRFQSMWDAAGALPPDQAVAKMLDSIRSCTLENTGTFVNASDARYEINGPLPW